LAAPADASLQSGAAAGAQRHAAGAREARTRPAASAALDRFASRPEAKERRSNVRQAFDIHPRWAGALAGKAVLLVDHVLTTGATVDACIRTLERGGARQVDVLTLARVVRPAL
jgi:predicted amidophosphoribosyltransferase